MFDDLPSAEYYKTVEAAAKHIKGFSENFPDVVGYDRATDGFIAIHSGHSKASLRFELPACLILKNAGYSVVLLEESSHRKSPDLRVNGILFEVKYISKAKTLKNAMVHQFRTAKGKCAHLLLHIDQPVKSEQVRSAIFYASNKFVGIIVIWVVWRKQLFQFDRDTIIKGRHQFL